MATYTYTGRLTDFSEQPFPTAQPKLWVEATQPAIGEQGLLAPRRIPVVVDSDGSFTVTLVPSVDTTPDTTYVLHVRWLHGADDVLAGWAQWEFTALVGGGPIKDMVGAPASVWWVGPPWPEGTPPGFYFDRITNDVGRKE